MSKRSLTGGCQAEAGWTSFRDVLALVIPALPSSGLDGPRRLLRITISHHAKDAAQGQIHQEKRMEEQLAIC